MKNFDKSLFLEEINNLELKKTINKFLDGLIAMEKSNKFVYCSNFFSPLEFLYVKKFLKNFDLKYEIIFPTDEYDRNIVIISNEYFKINDFIEIITFKDDGFEHRHILGSVLNKGINREKIGDIIKFDGIWYVYCLKPIGTFIFSDGLKIGKKVVNINLLSNFLCPKNFKKFDDIKIIVSSLRLDCFIKELVKTSRENSKKFIKHGNVKLNYDECIDVDKKIFENDIISIRGVGKFKVSYCEGITKKEKYVVNVKRYGI